MPRVYFDACCLNRPFDDQTQDRIRLESEAVLLIMSRFQDESDSIWVGSDVLRYEADQIPDSERHRRVAALLGFAEESQVARTETAARAQVLQGLGFKAVDALHIACAEQAGCDDLLTTDDRMLGAARRNSDQLHVRVRNPIDWVREVGQP